MQIKLGVWDSLQFRKSYEVGLADDITSVAYRGLK
jgi:hypothetical protein